VYKTNIKEGRGQSLANKYRGRPLHRGVCVQMVNFASEEKGNEFPSVNGGGWRSGFCCGKGGRLIKRAGRRGTRTANHVKKKGIRKGASYLRKKKKDGEKEDSETSPGRMGVFFGNGGVGGK